MFWLCFTDVSLNLGDVSQCCSDSLVMCQDVFGMCWWCFDLSVMCWWWCCDVLVISGWCFSVLSVLSAMSQCCVSDVLVMSQWCLVMLCDILVMNIDEHFERNRKQDLYIYRDKLLSNLNLYIKRFTFGAQCNDCALCRSQRQHFNLSLLLGSYDGLISPWAWIFIAWSTSHVHGATDSLRSDIDIFHHLEHVKHFKHFNHVKHVKCNYLQQWHKYLYFSGVGNSHGESGMKQVQLLVVGGKWKWLVQHTNRYWDSEMPITSISVVYVTFTFPTFVSFHGPHRLQKLGKIYLVEWSLPIGKGGRAFMAQLSLRHWRRNVGIGWNPGVEEAHEKCICSGRRDPPPQALPEQRRVPAWPVDGSVLKKPPAHGNPAYPVGRSHSVSVGVVFWRCMAACGEMSGRAFQVVYGLKNPFLQWTYEVMRVSSMHSGIPKLEYIPISFSPFSMDLGLTLSISHGWRCPLLQPWLVSLKRRHKPCYVPKLRLWESGWNRGCLSTTSTANQRLDRW